MDFEMFNEVIYEKLPDLIKELTDQFEGREKDVILISTIGVLSSVVPNVYGIYHRHKVFSNIYTMILAPPASGKGVMVFSRKLVEKIDAKIIRDSKKEIEKADKNKIPGLQVKIIPGNISSSDMYDKIKNAHYGGLIFESEADTINTIMKQDFGDFSDVLRKAFHHETLSISRKMERQFDKIKRPKLSVVLSGTPDQLKPFIKSTSNGLFSRILYYYFTEIDEWKDVFQESETNIEELFIKSGDVIYEMYGELFKRSEEVKFSFTSEQRKLFNLKMKEIYEKVVKEKDLNFVANVKRQGLILFRIAMTLSVIRKWQAIENSNTLFCEDDDFAIVESLMEPLIIQAYTVFNLYKKEVLTGIDSDIYEELPKVFKTSQLIAIGKKHNVPERTIKYRLNSWINSKHVVKIFHGKYRKVNN